MALVFIRSSWTLWDFTHPLAEAQHTIISISQPRTCNVKEKKFPQIMQADMMQILQQLTLFFFFFFWRKHLHERGSQRVLRMENVAEKYCISKLPLRWDRASWSFLTALYCCECINAEDGVVETLFGKKKYKTLRTDLGI